MITYSTNNMCIVNRDWVAEHGDCWQAGRIDIRGVKDEPFGLEYGIPPMHVADWNQFSDYLDTLHTEELLTFEQLIEDFEELYERNIIWCSEK